MIGGPVGDTSASAGPDRISTLVRREPYPTATTVRVRRMGWFPPFRESMSEIPAGEFSSALAMLRADGPRARRSIRRVPPVEGTGVQIDKPQEAETTKDS